MAWNLSIGEGDLKELIGTGTHDLSMSEGHFVKLNQSQGTEENYYIWDISGLLIDASYMSTTQSVERMEVPFSPVGTPKMKRPYMYTVFSY